MDFMTLSQRFSIVLVTLLFTTNMQAAVTYSMPLNGKEQMIGNLLEWSTAVESNSDIFVVEKSLDGIDYENVGVIEAAGESLDVKGYRFLDINSGTSKSYYRLRQLDEDGTGSISETVMIKRKMQNQMAVVNMSNTSTNDKFVCNIDAKEEGNLEFALLNLDNDLIQSGQQKLTLGLNELALSLKDEPVGVYTLQFRMNTEIETLVIRKTEDAAEIRNNVASKNKNK